MGDQEKSESTKTRLEAEKGKLLDVSNGATASPQYIYPQNAPDGPYQVLDQHHSRPTKLRVACIGAGASGLCLAYKLGRMVEPGSWELTLYEKNDQIGGTWYENTYPGVACDIPSHLYTFSFDPNPEWSHYYAYGGEIQHYFEGFAERHDLRKYVKLNTKLVEARWNEDEAIWKLTLEDQHKVQWSDWSHCLVNGSGILNDWKWPEVDGLHDFEGQLVHSAAWKNDIDLTGKTVGVIGTGSSSIQIVPQLQKICKDVKVFMRSPTWISPPFGSSAIGKQFSSANTSDAGFRQYEFTEEDKRRFREDPDCHLKFRKSIEAEINGIFRAYHKGSPLNNIFREKFTSEMKSRIGPGNDDLKSFIIPDFSPGCRRISPGDGYLEALVKPNVEPVLGGIKNVNKTGIVTEDGKQHSLDVLVCATGFQVAFKPAFNLINGAGTSLKEDWGDGVNLYFGVSTPRFPNYYTIVGPGSTWSNGTLLPSIETTVEYSIKMMRKLQQEAIKCMDVKQEAVDDIYAHFDEFHKRTVFSENCRSWFKDGKIKNRIYLWPGSTVHFLKTIKEPRMEDYNVVYRYKNRFAFLGNGDTKAAETKDVEGLSAYVRNSDHEWNVS